MKDGPLKALPALAVACIFVSTVFGKLFKEAGIAMNAGAE